MTPTDKFQDHQIARALDRPEDLTEWELEFLESVAERDVLTDKQRSVLNRIIYKLDFGG